MSILRTSLLTLAASCIVGAYAVDTDKIVISSANPMPGSIITQFNYTRLTLSEPMDVASVEQTGEISYVVKAFGADETVTPGYPLEAVKTKSGDISIQFTADAAGELQDAGKWPVTDPGQYVITIPEGALKVTSATGEEYTNDLITLSYDLLRQVSYTATPTPDEKIAEFDQIKLQFPEYGEMIVNNEFDATLRDQNGVIIPLGEPTAIENVLIIPLAGGPCSDPSNYQFNLSAGSITLAANEELGEQINPAISFSFECVGNLKGEVKNISPEQGVVELLAGVSVYYTQRPGRNPECTESLKVYLDDEVIIEYNNTSVRVQYALDNDDPNLVCYTFGGSVSDFLRAPGVYRIEVPEGFMKFGEGDYVSYSDALSLQYIIQDIPVYTINPAPGNVDSLSEVTITFDNVTEIINNELTPDENGDGAISLMSNSIEPDFPTVSIDGNKITFTFAQTYSYRETYLFEIPFGALTLKTAKGNEVTFTGLLVSYTINRFPAPVATPAPGEYETLGEVTLTLTEGMTYSAFYLQPELRNVTANGEVGAIINRWSRDLTTPVKDAEAITFYAPEGYEPTPGNYALTVHKGAFMVNVPEGLPYESGFNSSELYYRYTIVPSRATEMTPEYEEGHEFIGQISTFDIYFEHAQTVELTEDAVRPMVVDSEGTALATEVTLSYIEDRAGLTVNFNPAIDVDGEYMVTIPAGSILLDSKPNPEYQLSYKLINGQSGVEAVEALTTVTVYAIDGTVVMRNADAAAVASLPRGLYIINGKKILK
ncbi:MAG: hypothetical protein K2H86_06330 [Muribaculaceae bacterium]|nr:hypothetical protein [Muribaculaceae bacterium]